MSVIESFFNKTFEAFGITAASSTSTDTAVSLGTGTCSLRPVQEDSKLFNESDFGQQWVMHTQSSINLKAANYIKIDSVNYDVKGVAEYVDQDNALETHKKLNLYKKQ